MVYAILLCLLREILLTGGFGPVVRSFRVEVAIASACDVVYSAAIALLCRSCTKIDAPYGQSDAFGIAVAVELAAEKPACRLFLLRIAEALAYEVGCPAVARAEVLNGLICGVGGERHFIG